MALRELLKKQCANPNEVQDINVKKVCKVHAKKLVFYYDEANEKPKSSTKKTNTAKKVTMVAIDASEDGKDGPTQAETEMLAQKANLGINTVKKVFGAMKATMVDGDSNNSASTNDDDQNDADCEESGKKKDPPKRTTRNGGKGSSKKIKKK